LEVFANELKILLFRVDPERLKAGENAAAAFLDGRIFEKKKIPDELGLLGLLHGPKFLIVHLVIAERFSHQVMVGEEFVDSPEEQRSECRIVKMRVNVVDLGLFNLLGNN
jgi:hypothetical protein